MKTIKNLAIKYLSIGIGIWVFKLLMVGFQSYFLDFIYFDDPLAAYSYFSLILDISSNVIVGSFILFDALKYTKNRFSIPLVAFLIPVIGVCFLLIENYLIQKTHNNEQ